MIERTNTILYCRNWTETVAFYRDVFAFRSTFANEWFVEFAIGDGSHLSIANADRATIAPAGGDGITLSWQVADLDAARHDVGDRGARPGAIHNRWGTRAVHLRDPEGHRIELWCPLTSAEDP